jgi:hypothetical protein
MFLTHLVTHLGLQDTVHVVVSDNAEAAAVGLYQEVKLLGKPEAKAQTYECFNNRQAGTIEKKIRPWLLPRGPKGRLRWHSGRGWCPVSSRMIA